MSNTISNTDDVIDSRDVIERIEDLQIGFDSWLSLQPEDKQDSLTVKDWAEEDADGDELVALLSLAEDAEGYCPDWKYGAQLIRDSYFEQAMDEMIEDCYPELGKDLPCFVTVTIDYQALQMDYTAVEFNGVTYWVR